MANGGRRTIFRAPPGFPRSGRKTCWQTPGPPPGVLPAGGRLRRVAFVAARGLRARAASCDRSGRWRCRAPGRSSRPADRAAGGRARPRWCAGERAAARAKCRGRRGKTGAGCPWPSKARAAAAMARRKKRDDEGRLPEPAGRTVGEGGRASAGGRRDMERTENAAANRGATARIARRGRQTRRAGVGRWRAGGGLGGWFFNTEDTEAEAQRTQREGRRKRQKRGEGRWVEEREIVKSRAGRQGRAGQG